MSTVRIVRTLGSWWLTALLLLVLWAVYLVLSFGRNPYPAWVTFLFHSAGGVALSIGLIVNISAASIRLAAARFTRPPLTADYVRSLDAYGEFPAGEKRVREAAEALLGRGMGSTDLERQGLRSVTGVWSFLPGTVFRAGLVLTLVSLMISAHGRRTTDAAMRTGDRKDLQGAAVTLTEVSADLPTDHLQVGDEGSFRLENTSVTIETDGRDALVTPGFPTRVNGRWYRLRHLGYSQSISVAFRGTRSDMTADLDLLPPGRSSAVLLPQRNGSLVFTLAPSRTITKGLLTGRQYDLAHPAYQVIVQEGKVQEGGRRMRPGDRAAVGPAQIELGDQGLSVRIQAVSDPGLLPLYAGMIVLLAGLGSMLSRFFWYEREVALLVRDGTLLIGTRDEFYSRWGVERFQRWADRLAEVIRP